MRTLKAYSRQADAIASAHREQHAAPSGVLVGVERDAHKEPYSWRVVSFDLHDAYDRASIVAPGRQRVSGVTAIMFARRLALVTRAPAPPAPARAPTEVPDLIGAYRAARRARRKVAA